MKEPRFFNPRSRVNTRNVRYRVRIGALSNAINSLKLRQLRPLIMDRRPTKCGAGVLLAQ